MNWCFTLFTTKTKQKETSLKYQHTFTNAFEFQWFSPILSNYAYACNLSNNYLKCFITCWTSNTGVIPQLMITKVNLTVTLFETVRNMNKYYYRHIPI